MLKRIVELSLRHRGVLCALALLLTGYGCYVTANAKFDVFPEFVQPQVTVQAEAPGLAPEQVEALVTSPIENVLSGVGNLQSIRSESIQGLSVVTAVFNEGTDVYIARQSLSENLSQLGGQLPAGVKEPTMSPLTSSTMDLLKFGLRSDKLSPMELRTFCDWVVKPRLLAVAGVAGVKVFGGEVKQTQIQVRPERLVALNLSLQDVLAAANGATGIRGAGFIETPAQRIVIQPDGQSLTPVQLGETVVTQHEDATVRLRDVAEVVEAGAPKFGDALINGKPGILMTTASQYGANTLEVTRRVEQALDGLKPVLASQGIEYIPALHRPATFIETALHNLKGSLLTGTILIVVVLFLFLMDLRTAFISFTAIPLSLLTAIMVLDHFGMTINTMTLGGLVVAIGMVVDDAIIDVENILRRARQNLTAANPRPLFAVVLDASLEVRSPVVYASLILVLVFLPVITMSGLQGKFFAPMGLAFILAILASLAVALTVTPALCLLVLSRIKQHEEPRFILRMREFHVRALRLVNRHLKMTIALAALAFAASVAVLPFLGRELLPDFREGHFVAQVSMTAGTSLPEMRRVGRIIASELLKNPTIQSVSQQIGRAERGEDTWPPSICEFHIELKPGASKDQAKVQDEIREVLSSFPGLQSEVLTFLGDRIGETVSGETAQVVVSVYGDDLDDLDAAAKDIARTLSAVPGAADVQLGEFSTAPRLAIRLRKDRVTQLGFRPGEILDTLETAYQGHVVGQTYEGNRVFDVNLILPPAERQDPEKVGAMFISNSQGMRLPLNQIADVYLTEGRESIFHDGARRRQTVTCNPQGRDVASFVAEAKSKIAATVKLPGGTYLEFTGAAEQQAKANHEFLLHAIIAAIGIALLLILFFGNVRNLILVIINVPFALVGGVFALVISKWFGAEATLSLGTLVGFVTLFGITMRNSILLISHYQHLIAEENMTWGAEAAERGATERLLPILMTALVTGLGLLPLAITAGEAGREIEGPMAVVILGGLVTSTILSLLVLPIVALRWAPFEKAPAQRKTKQP
ncbi:MAG TPA: efflux RND transporter permease subunit [Verrucomicrobiae bacterium]|jgi:CzcA family heavy metal efflux pump|nr:efflux RND transporter permease subunit [Verrucomicrobiae bacterium]